MMNRSAILLVLAMAIAAATAAVETTTINGTWLLPDSSPAEGGQIIAQLSTSGTAPDGAGTVAVSGYTLGTIDAAGTVAITLIPNDVITPSGTHYIVRIKTEGPQVTSVTEKWQIDTSPDPISVGSVTRLDVAPGLSVPAATIAVEDDDVLVGSGGVLDFGTNLSVTETPSGEMNITASGGDVAVEEDDASVTAAASTFDFGAGLDASESPPGEANIVVDATEGGAWTQCSRSESSGILNVDGCNAVKVTAVVNIHGMTTCDATNRGRTVWLLCETPNDFSMEHHNDRANPPYNIIRAQGTTTDDVCGTSPAQKAVPFTCADLAGDGDYWYEGPGAVSAPLSVDPGDDGTADNADLLDGVDGAAFVRSDADDTVAGVLTFTDSSEKQIILGDTGNDTEGAIAFVSETFTPSTYHTWTLGESGDGGLNLGASGTPGSGFTVSEAMIVSAAAPAITSTSGLTVSSGVLAVTTLGNCDTLDTIGGVVVCGTDATGDTDTGPIPDCTGTQEQDAAGSCFDGATQAELDAVDAQGPWVSDLWEIANIGASVDQWGNRQGGSNLPVRVAWGAGTLRGLYCEINGAITAGSITVTLKMDTGGDLTPDTNSDFVVTMDSGDTAGSVTVNKDFDPTGATSETLARYDVWRPRFTSSSDLAPTGSLDVECYTYAEMDDWSGAPD